MAARGNRSRRTGKRGWAERRWSERDARQVLASWQASGLNLGAWCRREGIGYERVRRWRQQLEAPPRRGRKAPRVLPVDVVDASPVGGLQDFELELPDGVRVRVPASFDESSLARVLRAIEARA